MKKLIALLLALMLPLCAGAETIAQQVNAPATYQADYYSNTGKTTVHVDAVVYVPDVESINTYAVTGRDLTLDDTKAVALAAAPGTDWLNDWQPNVSSGDDWSGNRDDYSYYKTDIGGSWWRSNLVFLWSPMHDGSADYSPYTNDDPRALIWAQNNYKEMAFGMRRVDTMLEYRYEKDDAVFYYGGYFEDVKQKPDANQKLSKQTLTWGEATAMAEEFIRQVSPDFVLSWVGQARGEGTNRKAYSFRFLRMIDGVPVTYTTKDGYGGSIDEQKYATPPKLESIVCTIDKERIAAVYWQNPWKIGETLNEDVQLLPFENIMEIFGTIAPLTIQNWESDKQVAKRNNNRWDITEIRLGYMPVLRKDNSGEWELRPVWDFVGIRTFGSEYIDHPGTTALTIDAIDGTVIDRDYGY